MDERGKKRKGGAEKKKALEVDALKCFKLTDYAFGGIGAKGSCSSAGSDGSSFKAKANDSEPGPSTTVTDDEPAPADDDQELLSPSLPVPEPSSEDGNQTEPVS